MIEPTESNLTSRVATEPLTRWLISAANNRRTLTYSGARDRLERECGFGSIGRASRVGPIAEAAQENLRKHTPSAPVLNVLLVRKDTRKPGSGAQIQLSKRFPNRRWLKKKDAHKHYLWEQVVSKAIEEVYAYPDWERLYKDIYKKNYKSDPLYAKGLEKDGLSRGRRGEGNNHKSLRLWVKDNPERIVKRFHGVRTETEVELRSGDRVDVVLYGESETIAIEVKSRDSNWADLQRGIYQCVKYKAVLRAQDDRLPIESWLITESGLDGDLKALARKLGIKHKIVSLT